ncbi:MAG: hypothetical protein JO122_09510, partial [Acetobacteraceae bacterium]|nr:hypothetical protein [Acetobacteraceae bacterium]
DAPDIPASWGVTSDSLSLWLARALKVLNLLLIKHCMIPAGAPATKTGASAPAVMAGPEPAIYATTVDCSSLVRAGILDPAFPGLLDGYAGIVHIAGPHGLPAAVDPANPPGHRLAT